MDERSVTARRDGRYKTGGRVNFFKLYMGDYQRDTGALSIAEHGAYFLMLQYHYATEKPLPKGKDLYRLLRCESKADRDAVDAIAERFWEETETGWVNNRAMKEMAKADHQRTVNREVGKRGGRPKQTESLTQSETESVIETEPINNPNQTPDTRHQTKTKSKALSSDARLQAVEVLEFLNLKARRAYRPTDVNLGLIAGRLKDGATVGDCKQVIAKKVREWGTDEKMEPYLRPATLFNQTKFDQYVGELVEETQ